jgi:hypothetical protein
MNDRDLDLFERELEALKPAPPPKEFVDRLAQAISIEAGRNSRARKAAPSPEAGSLWLYRPQVWLRWLAPATILVLAGILAWNANFAGRREATASAALKADEVKIGSTLVSSFDAVASTPDGEPVRFRCEEWLDEVRLSDRSRGLVYSQRVPRVTVVPVSFETY